LYSKGFYVQPTIIANLPRNHRLWREELFLPILLVDKFKKLEEALSRPTKQSLG
jgi:1-pyrroline-5-carboxylate dehydrogenase